SVCLRDPRASAKSQTIGQNGTADLDINFTLCSKRHDTSGSAIPVRSSENSARLNRHVGIVGNLLDEIAMVRHIESFRKLPENGDARGRDVLDSVEAIAAHLR